MGPVTGRSPAARQAWPGAGGRVLGVTARGSDLAAAQAAAYAACAKVGFKGAFYRRDIGQKGILREEK
ncbi:phosphoribosylglycinamide synthetase C domain-containing protein [Solidesulfovibrio carbinoliphilus]|uniref:phosphoribosylglycinamide synthetase C domain-containing protein n=1 Tax=Solidesulfovibrio carbinoliphilus TaxID=345370 RepID=UPI003AF400E5